ncbi:MAG: HAD-IA family hydrolase [Opitutaceae bacterium]|nr:HAD-IA family hydrolase [Opitutaceae bacterium]
MQLDIPAGDFAGYIFDLDGTLVDTMPLHYAAWRDTLREFGLGRDLSEELFYSLGGVPATQVAELINQYYGTRFDPMAVRTAKEVRCAALLPGAPLIEPVVAFARRVAAAHQVGVASGGPHEVVRATLAFCGLDHLFPVVVGADDVRHGKPAPDTFLLAAEKMGVPAEQCLVFEDAELGIQAAAAAGMKWVRVPRLNGA